MESHDIRQQCESGFEVELLLVSCEAVFPVYSYVNSVVAFDRGADVAEVTFSADDRENFRSELRGVGHLLDVAEGWWATKRWK